MTLDDLEARFLVHKGAGRFNYTHELAAADGVWFLCPQCFAQNGGPAGTHGVICWFVGRVPDDVQPGPGRWTPAGTGLADLTFVPGTPPRAVSVQLSGGCYWHGHVADGAAV